jgi:uncharacterized OB-fold protein
MLPALSDENRPFWTGGSEGHLLIQHCDACGRWQHPPAAMCGRCGGAVDARPVSGNGKVFSFTVNEQPFHPDVPPPYVIALVTLDEQDDLRLPTNLVGVSDGELRCGLPVSVRFEPHGDVFVPVFGPARPA